MKRKRPRFHISIAALSALVVIFLRKLFAGFRESYYRRNTDPLEESLLSVTTENQSYITSMLLWKVADAPI